ncbi:trypsin-like serine protease [Aestuariibacter sp. AA17]|uniref:Trypsin-like serine protease n=1 Tax=Fluctibacter corallii TaxID=2984329 RepID=A0ABT3A4L5_9ALTE|nr:trypsin-like serine protease [Aestuariibacter sp. AA17]MCV2883543.1 trypsin-like serine protease [Aestuariibacter sp. AA17]
MSKFSKIAVAVATALATQFSLTFTTSAAAVNKPSVTPKIVGGEEAQNGEFPWMSALYEVSNNSTSQLRVAGVEINSSGFRESPFADVTGQLVNCGQGQSLCEGVLNQVCLIERGDNTFLDKALTCEASGGIGAIIYNNEAGDIEAGTLTSDYYGTIPVVSVSQETGQSLLTQIGSDVSLSVSISDLSTETFTCGATYLGEGWLLTAAHCIPIDATQRLKVGIGDYEVFVGTPSNITAVYIHPDFNEVTFDSDYALLRANGGVSETIRLADIATTDAFVNANSVTTAIGWGGRIGYEPGEGPTGDFPARLHKVDTNLLTNSQCIQTYASSNGTPVENTFITDNMVCADVPEGGKATCQGDSGGPILVNDGSEWIQIGITSFGQGCGAQGYPSVYTRLARFDNWRDITMNGVIFNPSFSVPTLTVGETLALPIVAHNNFNDALNIGIQQTNIPFASIENGQCNNVPSGGVCERIVTFAPSEAGTFTANFDITSDENQFQKRDLTRNIIVLDKSEAFQALFTVDDDENIVWSTGGNADWQIANGTNAQSGDINDSQASYLKATVYGKGVLTFDWRVSSEVSSSPDTVFDGLYLYVNDRLLDVISGENAFAKKTVNLVSEVNRVEWVYRKDESVSSGRDNADIKNVNLRLITKTPPPSPSPAPSPTPSPAPSPSPSPTPSPSPAPTPAPSSGGGSTGVLMAGLLPILWYRRRPK